MSDQSGGAAAVGTSLSGAAGSLARTSWPLNRPLDCSWPGAQSVYNKSPCRPSSSPAPAAACEQAEEEIEVNTTMTDKLTVETEEPLAMPNTARSVFAYI